MSDWNPSHPLLCNESPWVNNGNSIWIASTMNLIRNLEKFNFPGKLAEDKRRQIVSLFSRDFLSCGQLNEPQVINAQDISSIDKEYLVEHFLSDQSFHQASIGEAFILDKSGEFLGLINLGDHLSLQMIDIREELESTWDKLIKIETHLMQSANVAFSPKFGFLTSDPYQCGTGFVAHVFLHLPALIYTENLNDVVAKNKDEGIEQTGLQGDPKDLVGDVVAFHNLYTLGVTEENILTSMRTIATKLILEEKSLRNHLRQDHGNEVIEIKDKVSRACGVLLHSYQIEAVEALQAISLLKLGLDLNWLTGTSQEALNHLLFTCRRAHLICQFGKDKISQEELPHRRAEFIHKALKGLELLV
jgi:protein arginine kinase